MGPCLPSWKRRSAGLLLAGLLGLLTADPAPAQQAEPLPPGALVRIGSRFSQVSQGVDRVSLSGDGKILATGDGSLIRLWNVDENTLRRAWPNNKGRVLALVLSPDAKVLVTAVENGPVTVWDAGTGQPRFTIATTKELPPPRGAGGPRPLPPPPGAPAGVTAPVRSLALSPDGKLLALGGGAGGDLRVWSIAGQKEQAVLKSPGAEVTAVTFAPDGKLAAGYGDGVLRLWDLGTGKARELGKQPGNGIACLAWTPDGKTLASSGGDSDTILLWDVAAGQARHTLRGERFAGAGLAFSSDGKVLASCSANLKMEAPVHFRPRPLPLPAPPLPPGKAGRPVPLLAVAAFPPPPPPFFQPPPVSPDHTIRLWDVASGQEIRKLVGHQQQVHALALAGDRLVSASMGGETRVWDLEGHFLRRLGSHTGMVRRMAFAPDSQTLFTSGDDATIRLWEARTGKELKQIAKTGGSGTAAFTRDGSRAAMVANGGVAGFDLKTGRELFQTAKQENTVAGLDFSPDGRRLASGTVRWLRLFDAQSGAQERLLDAHGDLIIRLAFAPDGKTLAACSWDRTISLWDVAGGQLLHRTAVQPSALESVAYSPDGRLLATGGTGGNLRLWEAATARPVRVLQERSGIVFALTFSPDSRFVAASGANNTLRLWEVASGQEVLVLPGHQAEVMSAAFSPDGKLLASGDWSATAYVWDWRKDWKAAATDDLDKLWHDLGSPSAAAAQRAVAALSAGGAKAVASLKKHIPQVKEATAEQIRQWLRDLGAERFTTRELASQRLKGLGRSIEPALRESLQSAESNEVRGRLEAILQSIADRHLSAEELRLVRAVQVLEQMGSPAARQVLEELSRGTHGPLVQDEARTALRRLAH